MANKRDINIFISLKDCFFFFFISKSEERIFKFPSFPVIFHLQRNAVIFIDTHICSRNALFSVEGLLIVCSIYLRHANILQLSDLQN